MAAQSLADRASAIARQARAYEDAKGSQKSAEAANDEPRPSPSPPRWHWVVYLPDGTARYVVLDEPMTQAQVRARFPQSMGAIPW